MDANDLYRELPCGRGRRASWQRTIRFATVRQFIPVAETTGSSCLIIKVKERDKKISLSAVYRALAVLTRQGLVRQLVLGSCRRFYEGVRPVESHHFVCLTCGGIFDLTPVLNKDDRSLCKRQWR